MKFSQETSDKLAISLSAICTLNCLFLPSLIVLSSGYISSQIDSEAVHGFLLFFAIPLSIFALSRGYKNHQKTSVLILGFSGLATMILAYFFGEAVSGKSAEQFFTVAGSLLVVYAHYINFRTCNDLNCDCHNSNSF